MSILKKIKKNNLLGRGGAGFPTALKWEMVKNEESEKKYIVCNAAEGEPGILKDGYIFEKYPEKVIDGIKKAINFLSEDGVEVKAYIYINKKYHKKYGKNLKKIIGDLPITLFEKAIDSGYIGGEESSILNAIEGKRIEPRLRPPFPTTSGLWGKPTLINNVETFYNVSLASNDEYKSRRFYTINGACPKPGVYELSEKYSINKILKTTDNYPKFDFFVQIGGDASGEVLNSTQLTKKVSGAGSITIYNKSKTNFKIMLNFWLDFFVNQSCGQCTPCREGFLRMKQIFNSEKPNWKLFFDLVNNLDETAFCALGKAAVMPIKTYIKNIENDLGKYL